MQSGYVNKVEKEGQIKKILAACPQTINCLLDKFFIR